MNSPLCKYFYENLSTFYIFLENKTLIADNGLDFANTQGGRLEYFYTQKGFKRMGFSKEMGVSYDRLTKWVNDENSPPPTFWVNLKNRFPDVDVGYIITGTPSVSLTDSTRTVPVLSRVPAGTLNFSFADEDVIEYVPTDNEKDKHLFALYVTGDSMYPELQDGDIVYCAPMKSFVNGQIYVVVTNEDETTIKKVFRAQGGYDLQPMNPDYERMFVSDENLTRLIPVVDMRRKYR